MCSLTWLTELQLPPKESLNSHMQQRVLLLLHCSKAECSHARCCCCMRADRGFHRFCWHGSLFFAIFFIISSFFCTVASAKLFRCASALGSNPVLHVNAQLDPLWPALIFLCTCCYYIRPNNPTPVTANGWKTRLYRVRSCDGLRVRFLSLCCFLKSFALIAEHCSICGVGKYTQRPTVNCNHLVVIITKTKEM